MSTDTIVALSSGALPSGVAVIRLSGPATRDLVTTMAGALPEPRRLTLSPIRNAGETLDQGLVAWFPAPHSFTGEDCAELQVHGSPAVVRAILRAATAAPASAWPKPASSPAAPLRTANSISPKSKGSAT